MQFVNMWWWWGGGELSQCNLPYHWKINPTEQESKFVGFYGNAFSREAYCRWMVTATIFLLLFDYVIISISSLFSIFFRSKKLPTIE